MALKHLVFKPRCYWGCLDNLLGIHIVEIATIVACTGIQRWLAHHLSMSQHARASWHMVHLSVVEVPILLVQIKTTTIAQRVCRLPDRTTHGQLLVHPQHMKVGGVVRVWVLLQLLMHVVELLLTQILRIWSHHWVLHHLVLFGRVFIRLEHALLHLKLQFCILALLANDKLGWVDLLLFFKAFWIEFLAQFLSFFTDELFGKFFVFDRISLELCWAFSLCEKTSRLSGMTILISTFLVIFTTSLELFMIWRSVLDVAWMLWLVSVPLSGFILCLLTSKVWLDRLFVIKIVTVSARDGRIWTIKRFDFFDL